MQTTALGPALKTHHYKLRSAQRSEIILNTPLSTDPSASSPAPIAQPRRRRSKTLAAWCALLLGSLGLHRIYLYGPRDLLAWLHLLPTLAGWVGLQRLLQLGQDDRWAWALVPVFGLMLSLGAFFAILYGLTPDERWDARHNPGQPVTDTRWGPVLAAILGLLLGGGILMGSITYGVQMFFQWELETSAWPPGPALALAAPAAVR
jgi:hypothetical protein